MKNKRIIIILLVLAVVITVIIGFTYFNKPVDNSNNKIKNEEISNSNKSDIEGVIEFLGSISGVKAIDIEILNNPVGFTGELYAPKESIKNCVDYYLTNTNNEKMEDLKIDIGDNFLSIYVNYKVNKMIKTPIEVKVNPVLNNSGDLVINIDEVKFLDIRIADWIVNLALNSFVKDWFPSGGDLKLEFNKDNVVVYRKNFKGVNINKLSLEEEGLIINVTIDLKEILNTTY